MIRFETFGTASAELAELQRRGEDLMALMERLGAELVALVKLGFSSSRSPYGVTWAALKLRQGQPLRDTGSLMNSITYLPASGSVIVGPAHGPSSKGAAVQQFGATIVPKNGKLLAFRPRGSSRWFFAKKVVVPARTYLPTKAGGLPEDWSAAIVRETAFYLMGQAA